MKFRTFFSIAAANEESKNAHQDTAPSPFPRRTNSTLLLLLDPSLAGAVGPPELWGYNMGAMAGTPAHQNPYPSVGMAGLTARLELFFPHA